MVKYCCDICKCEKPQHALYNLQIDSEIYEPSKDKTHLVRLAIKSKQIEVCKSCYNRLILE